jgi:hypothetical protein
LGWHFRIRIKATLSVLRPGQPACKVEAFSLAPGRALFLHNVAITAEYFGPVSLALARHNSTGESWDIMRDEPTSVHTFTEYGRRFDIEENFLAEHCTTVLRSVGNRSPRNPREGRRRRAYRSFKGRVLGEL